MFDLALTHTVNIHITFETRVIVYSEMFCILGAPPYEIITVHNISSVVTAKFATDFIEIASNIIGYLISIKEGRKSLNISGVCSSTNR